MDGHLFEQALDTFESRLRGVRSDDLHAPTPCTEWDVHALVNHLVNELRWVPPLLEGQTIAEVGDRFDGDLLGDDPQGNFHQARDEAFEAASRPGVRERIVHLSFGDTTADEYLSQLTSDLTIHAWDLARATGGDEQLDTKLVEAVHEFLAPQADLWRGAGVFGPAVDAAPDADLQARLLGLAGRQA